MLLNWEKPPQLDAPRRRIVHGQFTDRLKLARAKAKRAKGPKNHSTNKERSYEDRARAALIVKRVGEELEARRAHNAAVRAYWLGERDSHP